jgi:hypothetical protein
MLGMAAPVTGTDRVGLSRCGRAGISALAAAPCTRMRSTRSPGYQLKITLRDVRPPVWRRLVVPANLPLPILHVVFQVAMGWTDSHLHLFRLGDEVWTPASEEYDSDSLGEDTEGVALSELAPGKGSRFVYEYDFGDCWVHDVVVEKVLPEAPAALRCLEGKRACPPEDCGGPWGYAHLREVLADPAHVEHAELSEWSGPLDHEEFDAGAVDVALAAVWNPRTGRRGKKARKRRGPPTLESILEDLEREDIGL